VKLTVTNVAVKANIMPLVCPLEADAVKRIERRALLDFARPCAMVPLAAVGSRVYQLRGWRERQQKGS